MAAAKDGCCKDEGELERGEREREREREREMYMKKNNQGRRYVD